MTFLRIRNKRRGISAGWNLSDARYACSNAVIVSSIHLARFSK